MPCGTAGICGISSCFQLLSPGMRQVIHALLTRPPLSLRTLPTEIVRVRRSVRLACVKHAASVHPEPGSNSLAKYLPQAFACFYPSYCLGCFCSFLFLLFSNSKNFQELIHCHIRHMYDSVFRCSVIKVLLLYCSLFLCCAVRCSPCQLDYNIMPL